MDLKFAPYSYTKLDLILNRCPRHFYKKYVEQAQPEVTIEAFRKGIENHRQIQGFLLREIDELENKVLEASLYPIRENYEIQVEVPVFLELDGVKIFEGFADIVATNSEKMLILDIKSRYNTFEEGLSFGKDLDMQLSFYGNLLKDDRPLSVGVIALHNKFSPVATLPFERINKFPNFPEDFLRLLSTAERKIKEHEERGFPPTYVGCEYCEYVVSCGAQIENSDDIFDIAQQLRVLEARVKELKSKVKKFCEENGVSITVGDYEYGFFPTRKIVYDKKELLDYLIKKKRYDLLLPDLRKLEYTNDENLLNLLGSEFIYEFRGRKTRKNSSKW